MFNELNETLVRGGEENGGRKNTRSTLGRAERVQATHRAIGAAAVNPEHHGLSAGCLWCRVGFPVHGHRSFHV